MGEAIIFIINSNFAFRDCNPSATADGTDCFQVRFCTFEAKPVSTVTRKRRVIPLTRPNDLTVNSIKIKVVLQLHMHRHRMPALHRWSKLDLTRSGNGALRQSKRQRTHRAYLNHFT
jgi:hypothetical protein